MFATDPLDVDFCIHIINDHHALPNTTKSDSFSVVSKNNNILDGVPITYLGWSIQDTTGTALSSTALPTTAPVLGDWDPEYNKLHIEGMETENCDGFDITCHVTKSTKSMARNIHSAESEWEDPLSVSMPKNKAINPFILFLERLMERFPILEQILQPIYDKLAGF